MFRPRKNEEVEIGSERSFALVFATVLAIIGFWPLVRGEGPRVWAIAVGLGFLGIGYVRPTALRPLNFAWFRFGRLLGAVVTPAIMALLYTIVFLPTGLILRLTGKDPLALKRAPDRPTYWVQRADSRPEQDSMKDQF